MSGQATWYKDAIFYELRVRSFFDSVGDGMGDLPGVTQKLDYLQDLGVTALWLLPFYPSPLRDDGYDIADYLDVHPDCGTLADFRGLVREAHRRGLKVVTELVLNHTSDQHPWFKKARRPGRRNPWRDYYVWSDTPDRFPDARIIFKDFERSNWTWDPVAGAHYWHRFYSHQPDLNFDNPRVRRAMLRVVDFWLRLGVDGLRLDAIPYLYERAGSNCENLPETHAFLRELRAHVDARFADRMLLGEANQWPEDAIAYFGAGDECSMAFHFPLMPRLFSALHMERSFPLLDILAQTPPIPESCQWAIFLRNHDELTLEMVTDEERDYMYRVYAQDATMRLNLGIRRRLAPLLGNNRRKLELMNSLLLSLPGTPVIYYGDEIGMGDNVYLGDRNGVRTPMQWSGDRNAGFSAANPQRLFLPPVIDPEYHYVTVNVEAQQRNPHSLLWWMKRLIALRKRYKAFGRGTFEVLTPANARVLAFVRRFQEEQLLVVANLSRFVQYVELDLSAFQGLAPVELFSRTTFPPVGPRPYFLTLSPHAFYWFSLEPERPGRGVATGDAPPVPALEVEDPWDVLSQTGPRRSFEERLPAFLASRPWIRERGTCPRVARIIEAQPLPLGDVEVHLVVVQAEYVSSPPETFVLPLAFATGDHASRLRAETPGAVVALLDVRGADRPGQGVLYDAATEPSFGVGLLEALAHHRVFSGVRSSVRAVTTPAFRQPYREHKARAERTVRVTERHSTLYVLGDEFVLKFYRRVEEGVNPGIELGRFLTERAGFTRTPAVAGYLEYRTGRHGSMSLGVLHRYVPNHGTAWRFTLDSLGHYLDSVLACRRAEGAGPPPVPPGSVFDLAALEVPPGVREVVGGYLDCAGLLGRHTAELHLALASALEEESMAPEPFSRLYQRSLYQAMRNLVGTTLQLLRERSSLVPTADQPTVSRLLASERTLHGCFEPVRRRQLRGLRTRYHGNLSLSEVLATGTDFVFIDFEGDPTHRRSAQRIKRSPLRDVACMLASFRAAAAAMLQEPSAGSVARAEDLPALEPWLDLWYRWVAATYLRSYLARWPEMTFLPSAREDLEPLLDAFLLERALLDLGTLLTERPDRAGPQLARLLALLVGPAPAR